MGESRGGNMLPKTPEEVTQQINEHANGEDDLRQIEDQAAGYYYWLSSLDRRVEKGHFTSDTKNRMIAHVLTLKDLKEEQRYAEGRIDTLTGLPRREEFETSLNELIASGVKFGALQVDIDHFKNLNDTYGHHAGDQTLVQTSLRMLNAIRQTPIIMPGGIRHERKQQDKNDILARVGGEEFWILLPGIENEEQLSIVGTRVLKEFSSVEFEITDNNNNHHSIPVTASIGGALFNRDKHATKDDFKKDVDSRLYDAKHSGRNQVIIGQKTS